MATCKDCLHYEVCNEYFPRFMKERLKLGEGWVCVKFHNKCENCPHRERKDD